jgi:hypothetical protein
VASTTVIGKVPLASRAEHAGNLRLVAGIGLRRLVDRQPHHAAGAACSAQHRHLVVADRLADAEIEIEIGARDRLLRKIPHRTGFDPEQQRRAVFGEVGVIVKQDGCRSADRRPAIC